MENLTVKVIQELDKVTYTISKKRTLIFTKTFTSSTAEKIELDLFHFFGIARAVKYLKDNKLDYTISSTSHKAIFWVIVKKVDIDWDINLGSINNDNDFKKAIVDSAIAYLKTVKTPHLLKN